MLKLKVDSRQKQKEQKKFSYLEDPSKSIQITDPALTGKYDSRVVLYAERLKYQHEHNNTSGTPYHSDEYYLDYAQKSFSISSFKGAMQAFNRKFVMNNNVPDPAWAEYSYEEIIQMANDGVYVPKKVLAWAQGEQEAALTSYIVITDEVKSDDNSSTGEDTRESKVNALRKKTKENIVKTVKQEEIVEQQSKQVRNLGSRVNATKIIEENFKESSNDKIEKKTKRLKELSKKSEDSGLNQDEKREYKKLKAELNQDSELRKKMAQKALEMDDFLSSIDDLKSDCEESSEIASETISVANELANYEKAQNETIFKVHNVNAVKYVKSDTLADVLENMPVEYIPTFAIKESGELNRIINKEDSLYNQFN